MNSHNKKNNDYQNNKPIESLVGKSLPASIEAERAILNALILNASQVTIVSEIIGPHDFYLSAHKLVFQSIIELEQKKKQIDIITIQMSFGQVLDN